MRRTASAVTGLVAVATLVGGCGSNGAKVAGASGIHGSPPAAAPGHSTTSGQATTPTTTAPAVKVGDPATLTGPGGLSVVVQVASIVDPATAANSYDMPGSGMHYVAVKLALDDSGPVGLTTDLQSDVQVDDGGPAPVGPIVLDMSDCPVNFGGDVILESQGPVSVSCVAFELPTSSQVRSVHVAIAAGTGGQATWTP